MRGRNVHGNTTAIDFSDVSTKALEYVKKLKEAGTKEGLEWTRKR